MKKFKCKFCSSPLSKDCVALNKKLNGRNAKDFLCLTCMADEFDCTEDDLRDKIEDLKEQGCTLFM